MLVGRGGKLFVGLVATLIGAELVLLGLQIFFGSLVAIQTCERMVPELALLYFVWRGVRWANHVLAACFAIVGVMAIVVLVTDRWAWSADLLISGWSAVLAAWAVVLVRSPALEAYQRHQRS